jgi:hypothetical protein
MLARLDRTHALCAKVSPQGRVSSPTAVAMRTHGLATRGALRDDHHFGRFVSSQRFRIERYVQLRLKKGSSW